MSAVNLETKVRTFQRQASSNNPGEADHEWLNSMSKKSLTIILEMLFMVSHAQSVFSKEKKMKKLMIFVAGFFFLLGFLEAAVFHSTLAGGPWMDPETWQSTSFPGAEDDVFIHGIVTLYGQNYCHNLSVIGADAMLQASGTSSGTITIYGDLSTSGWISSSNYNLTVNLYGDLDISYHFVPYAFNWLGSGNRYLSCADNYQGINTRYQTTISTAIDTIFAASDIYFAPGTGSRPLITGNGHKVVLCLFDNGTRSTYNLYSRSCKLDNLIISGNGNSICNFNNDSGLSDVSLLNCDLENLVLTGTHQFESGCSIYNIVNNGNIYNYAGGSASLNQYESLVNNGQIGQAPYGYNFSLYSYGDIYNNGLFNPTYLYLRGSNPRTLQSSQQYPLKASISLTGETGLGDIYPGTELFFANISSLNGPFNLKAYTLANIPRTLNFNNVRIYNSSLTGILGSALQGTDLWLSNTPVSCLDLYGVINFTGNSTLSYASNFGTIQNGTDGSGTLAIYGDFANQGTVRSSPSGYTFTVNAWDDVRNYGIWTAYRLNLYGDDAQEICFGAEHPYAGTMLNDMNNAAGVYVVETDLYLQATQVDLNNSPLYLNPGAFDLYLNGTVLYNAVLVSDLNCTLTMTNSARVSGVSFQSITNAGILEMISNTGFSGDLVNNGTVQNSGSSASLTVAGNIINNGTIRNYGGYNLYLTLAGNAVNNGAWSNNSLSLNGSQPQQVSFPSGHAFSGTSFTDSNAASAILSIGDLYLANTTIDLNNAALDLGIGHGLYLDNCMLIDAVVLSELSSVLNMTNGGNIQSCSFQSISTSGTVSLQSNTTISGALLNYGAIRNLNGSYSLFVQGDLDNRGSLGSYGGYHLYLYASQNVLNSGTISSRSLSFNGSVPQTLSNSGSIAVTELNDTVSASPLTLLTDLSLTNTSIDLHGATLILTSETRQGKTLSLSGGYLINGNIVGGNGAKLVLSNSAYLYSLGFDDIIWEGTILLAGTIYVNNLGNYATLQNRSDGSGSLNINGRLDNYAAGIVQNNSYNFTLNAYGDIYNYGQMKNYEINFRSSENQFFYNSPTADTLRCFYLRKSNTAGSLTLLSNLNLKNSRISFNNRDFILEYGRTAYCITLQGGYIENTNLVSTAFSGLSMSSGAYLAGGVNFGNQIWNGTILINGSVYGGALQNQGLATNLSGYTSYLYLTGRLENYGTMANDGAYNMYLYLYDDLYNYGYLSSRIIYMNGSDNQEIYQDPSADAIRSQSIRKTNASGALIMLSDLRLISCYLDLNGRSLMMHNEELDHGLYMNGGYVINTQLVSPGNSILNLTNNCYLYNITGGNHSFEGEVILSGTCIFETIINNGYTRNQPGYSVTAYINGNLINNGTFYSDSYPLYLRVAGNLQNSGTLANRRVYLTGSANQNVILSGTQSIEYLTLNSNIGSAAWYYNGSPSGLTGTYIELGMTHPQLFGTWQPYVTANNIWGREISISPAASLNAPANLLIQSLTDGIKLHWDQVSGAVSYKIYASDNPYGGFELLIGGITDPALADGYVEYALPSGASRKFFQVIAVN